MFSKPLIDPITRKRLLRFKELKRAHVSFWILVLLYTVSLFSEFICNDKPVYLHFKGKSYFPIFRYYPEREFLADGADTRPDYRRMAELSVFKDDPDNYMVFPPIPFGPYESIAPEEIELEDHVEVRFKPEMLIGSVDILPDHTVAKGVQFGAFVGLSDLEIAGFDLSGFITMTDALGTAMAGRFDNLKMPAFSETLVDARGKSVEVTLPAFNPRRKAPRTVRLRLRELEDAVSQGRPELVTVFLDPRAAVVADLTSPQAAAMWESLGNDEKDSIREGALRRFDVPVEPVVLQIDGERFEVSFYREDVLFPFRPFKGHWLGVDSAGRDVFARILYGMRTSMSFGLLLVVCTMALGIAAGALQGYYGGAVDITAQRLIEIWSALPFLYVMILMGSVFGRSFALLLFCYGIFNWIGISYYMRAEFLNLRHQPFVEAAKCLGVPARRIIFRHIMPNGLIPVITFFPFSLVGAIGSLAVLDYLGFGLPAPTPSWGELMFQAQQFRWAWWLILYPSLALFMVMLLGVFVGEGVRNAFDPKRFSKLE